MCINHLLNSALMRQLDQNSAADAADKFRQLAAVVSVLKSKEQRAVYDTVLREGELISSHYHFHYHKQALL